MSEVNRRRGAGRTGQSVVMALIVSAMPGASAQALSLRPEVFACPAPAAEASRPGGWYRRVAELDARGWLTGYTLRAGTHTGAATLRVRLPAASFVSGPARGVILYGSDDGTRSMVRTVRLSDGCDRRLLVSDDVVRSAMIDPAGETLYFHMVDRSTRADRGVWRRSLDSSQDPEQVVPGLHSKPEGAFGPTAVTLLTWSASGRTLAVQSCGEVQCRTRLYRPGTGVIAWDERPGQGELLGLTDSERYGYRACHGLPCPIVATTPDGRERTIASAAGVATLVGSGKGVALWYEATTSHGQTALHHLLLASGRDRTVDPGRLRLTFPGRWAAASIEAPAGHALFSADGTWSAPGDVKVASVPASSGLRLQSIQEVAK